MAVDVPITEEQFEQTLKDKLGSKYDRALKLFCEYGSSLSMDVLNSLLHAFDNKNVSEVLGILEDHFENDLQFQHPAARGQLLNSLHQDKTAAVFHRINTKVAPPKSVAQA